MTIPLQTKLKKVEGWLWLGPYKLEDLPKYEDLPEWLRDRIGFTGIDPDGLHHYATINIDKDVDKRWNMLPGQVVIFADNRLQVLTQEEMDHDYEHVSPYEGDSEPIHSWFGLSYASYVVMPRSILQSCSPETQQLLVKAFEAVAQEEREHLGGHWPHDGSRVAVTLRNESGRFIKDPWCDYERGRRRAW
jgi:hypothetical protein